MKKKFLAVTLTLAMVAGMLVGCGSNNTTSSSIQSTDQASNESTTESQMEEVIDTQPAKKFKILSIWAEDTNEGKMLYELTQRFQEEINPNFEFDFELVSSSDLTTKVATLVASNDLPDAFAYVSGKPLTELIDAGKVVNITKELESLGSSEYIKEGAVSLLKGLTNTEDIYDLPLGLNIEGFWYNKAVFEANSIEVPNTWDELLEICDVLLAKGIQPLAAGGADKWPLSRYVNAYVVRTMGTDALAKATSGQIKFTDEKFIEAAAMISGMAEKGYFGKGVTTVDNTTAANMVLAGEAAICYNGSWMTSDILADTNPAGADGIGYFPIPVVDESVSAITEIPMNCGNILALSADKYDEATAQWLKFFVENAGDYSMSVLGADKGYKYDVEGELNVVSQMVVDAIGSSTKAATWFEAMMNNETKAAAQDNVQMLINGEMSAKQYMESIQNAYDLNQ